MTDINSITLVCRLTKDVGSDERDFGYLQNGTCYAKLSVAVNESKKGQDGNWQDYANYFEVHVYGKTAENLKPYLTKGQQICVKGALHQDRWEKDGQKQSRVSIIADQVQLLGGKSDSNNSESTSSYAQQYENQKNPFKHSAPIFKPANNAQSQAVQQDNGGFQEDLPYDEQDIPF